MLFLMSTPEEPIKKILSSSNDFSNLNSLDL